MSVENPYFSIVMPTYNQSKYLSAAVQSVLNQDYDNWQLVIIDNFSEDETIKILEELSDPRIEFYRIRNEGIVAKSRNLGIENSKAPWVAFLDSDDLWDKNKLSKVAECIRIQDPDFIYHRMRYSSAGKIREIMRTRKLKEDAFMDLYLNGNTIPNSSVVTKKNLLLQIGLINESRELIGIEDFNTWLKIAKLGSKYFYLNEVLGTYRIHDSNLSKKSSNPIPREALTEFYNEIPLKLQARMISNYSYLTARMHLRKGELKEAKSSLIIALKGAKLNLKIKSLILIIFSVIRH